MPVDQYGQVLAASDLLAWFGLNEVLTVGELLYIKEELAGMIEAEIAVERLKQAEQAW